MFARKREVAEVKERVEDIQTAHKKINSTLSDHKHRISDQETHLGDLSHDLKGIRTDIGSFTSFTKKLGIVLLVLMAGDYIPLAKIMSMITGQ